MTDNPSLVRTLSRLRPPSLERASALYLFAFVIVLFGVWIPDTFLTSVTFRLVAADQVVIAILALAILVPLVVGAFDLSVGAMLAFSLVVLTWLEANTGLNAVISSLVAIAACGLVGFLSGLLVVRFRVNSFIATLGMSQILAATSLWISENRQIAGVFSDKFLSYGRRDVAGVPIVFVYLIVLALVVWYVLQATPLGRNMFATGSNPEAARLSGVKTDGLVWSSLVVSALIAGRLRHEDRLLLELLRAAAAVPGVRRGVLRCHAVHPQAQRLGHPRRGLRPRVRRQGPSARVHEWRLLDHAHVQRGRAPGRRDPREPDRSRQASSEPASRGGSHGRVRGW